MTDSLAQRVAVNFCILLQQGAAETVAMLNTDTIEVTQLSSSIPTRFKKGELSIEDQQHIGLEVQQPKHKFASRFSYLQIFK